MSAVDLNNKTFGKIRNLIWPIHSHELKKLIPMFCLSFLIALAYNLLHCLKIPLIVKAQGASSEVIPFLQIVAILPAAVGLSYLYTKLINRFKREHVFYIIVGGFLAYFVLFVFVLYPNHQNLQLNATADFLQNYILPADGFKGFTAAVRNLNLTIFYVSAEMWSVMVLFMLFWGFANEVTLVEEAKRFYGLFGLGGNLSGIVAGVFASQIQNVGSLPAISSYQGSEWLFCQLSFVMVLCVMIMALYWWINRNVFTAVDTDCNVKHIASKRKPLAISECFKYLKESRYVLYMVLIVLGYYIVYNLSEIIWAYKIEQILKTSKEINAYMGHVHSITWILSVFIAFFISGNVLRKFGWTIAALVTPVIWLLTSIGFFSSMAFEGSMLIDSLSMLLNNPTNLVLIMGSLQICLGRSCKYTLFDESKEIAFIPLTKEEQRKCKVVVDGIASRFGKSGASVIYIVLFSLFGGIANCISYVTVIIAFALCAWIYATLKMGAMINDTKKVATSSSSQQLKVAA